MKKSIGAKTLPFAVPVFVIGSYDEKYQPNLITCAWGGVCSSEPPCVNISLRRERHSYHNIVARKAFTFNILFANQVQEVDFYGIVSGNKYNKFEKTEITPVKSEIVDAPYGEEFPIVLECKVINQVDVGSHIIFIGEIVDIKIDNTLFNKDDKIDRSKLNPIFYIPAMKDYFSIGKYLGKGYSIGKRYVSS